MRQPEDIVGRLFEFFAFRQTLHGSRLGRVTRVKATRRGLVTITVRLFNSMTGAWNGRKVVLTKDEWAGGRSGVMWHGKPRPVLGWLQSERKV